MQSRCSYFSTDSLILPAECTAVTLRVPVYRCRLSETLIARLDESAHPSGCVPLGPDLNAISPATCCTGRCRSRCRDAFQEVLHEYGRDTHLPETISKVRAA